MDRLHPDLGRLRLLPRWFVLTPLMLRPARWLLEHVRPGLGSGVDVSDVSLPAGDHDIAARVYRPAGANGDDRRPVLLWIHGGGTVMGTHKDDAQCGRLVREIGIVAVSPRYRLAPEHPYPAGLDDIMRTVDWLHSGGVEGVSPSQMCVGGQSAGGGLAAAAALRARDQGLPLLGQLLVYPMLDDRTAARSDVGKRAHYVWNNQSNEFAWASYLRGVESDADRLAEAVPGRTANLDGLPPTWIGVGSLDLFHDEAVDYARRLTASGNDCELVVVGGAAHGFDMIVPKAGISRDFAAQQVSFLRERYQHGR